MSWICHCGCSTETFYLTVKAINIQVPGRISPRSRCSKEAYTSRQRGGCTGIRSVEANFSNVLVRKASFRLSRFSRPSFGHAVAIKIILISSRMSLISSSNVVLFGDVKEFIETSFTKKTCFPLNLLKYSESYRKSANKLISLIGLVIY